MPSRPIVYISYSHKDAEFVAELTKFLRPFERSTDFDVWSDQEIKPGEDWNKRIIKALDEAAIAILLVSPDYLASDFIHSVELPRLLERQQNEGISLLPIVVRPAAWVQTPLAYLQVLPRDGRAISELSRSERDRLWADFVELLVGVLHRQQEPRPTVQSKTVDSGIERIKRKSVATKRSKPEKSTTVAKDSQFFISHAKEDGDFAENLKFRMSEAGLTGWIDIDVLEAGTDWRKEIDEAILASRALILVLSPDAKASEYVTYEWAFGHGTGLRIVPILLRTTPIHPRLEAFQYLDFTNRRARPWTRLFALLSGL